VKYRTLLYPLVMRESMLVDFQTHFDKMKLAMRAMGFLQVGQKKIIVKSNLIKDELKGPL
jgi:hypothetical protein